MDPLTILAISNAMLAFLKIAIPQVKEWTNSGEIDATAQAKELAEFNSLKNDLQGHFTGPEWEKSGR